MTATVAKTATREQILAALNAFAHQRPGVDPRNYFSDWRDTEGRKAWRSEVRSITRDLHDFRALLAQVSWRSITVKQLKAGFRAYSGRLTLTEREDGSVALDYCTGQYFPTEYRKAACAVLGAVLFDYFRNCFRDDMTEADKSLNMGDAIRKAARLGIGARLQKRWVD